MSFEYSTPEIRFFCAVLQQSKTKNLPMRRDSIFYQLFQQSPALLFELLDTPPANAQDYRFDSVAVKEPRFEINGVFLLPEAAMPGGGYFYFSTFIATAIASVIGKQLSSIHHER